MSNHENTVNRTIDGDSAEGHLKLQLGETEIHERKLDEAAEGHNHRTNLDDETEGHLRMQIDDAEVNDRI